MIETSVRNLMFDLGTGREIYDVEAGRAISRAEASETIRKACFEYLGLNEKSTNKQIKRALNSEKGREFFAVIEEIIETQIQYGFAENEFFNTYVETKNIADGDRNEFWVDDEVLLTVSKMSGDHHDISIKRLGSGQSYNVTTDVYGIKVGDDIRLFLTGRKDWGKFVEAVVNAFMRKIQELISAQFASTTNMIPTPSVLTGTGTLVKTQFDALIEKVGAANGTNVVIMGTKTALKNLTALAKVDFADPSDSIKDAVAMTGIIGNYEGTALMEIPQKFKDKALTQVIVPNNKIWIIPATDDKFIKFVDYGETELEITEKGATQDDMQSYEVQRRFGVATLMDRYHAVWTI